MRSTEEQMEEQDSHALTQKDQDPSVTLILHPCSALKYQELRFLKSTNPKELLLAHPPATRVQTRKKQSFAPPAKSHPLGLRAAPKVSVTILEQLCICCCCWAPAQDVLSHSTIGTHFSLGILCLALCLLF